MPDEELSFSIDTSGFDEALAQIDAKVATGIMRDALQAGGDVVLAEMKTLASEFDKSPIRTPDSNALPVGILEYDLTTDVYVKNGSGNVRVGPTKISGHVARWINNGWTLTGHKPGKKEIREIPGKHFIEAALDVTGQAAIDAIATTIAAGIEEAQGK
jgi:hypothetical protein